MVGERKNVYYSLTSEIFGEGQRFATRWIHSYIVKFLGKETPPPSVLVTTWNNGLLDFHALLAGPGITVVSCILDHKLLALPLGKIVKNVNMVNK